MFSLFQTWKRKVSACSKTCNSDRSKTFSIFSISNTSNMLPRLNPAKVLRPNDEFSVFGVEPLHLLHPGSLKALKQCTVVCLKLSERHVPAQGNKREGRNCKPTKTQLLYGFNNFLAAYERNFLTSELHIIFSTSHLTGLFNDFSHL